MGGVLLSPLRVTEGHHKAVGVWGGGVTAWAASEMEWPGPGTAASMMVHSEAGHPWLLPPGARVSTSDSRPTGVGTPVIRH